jgi:solute carrier family 25 (mitochondrial carnitine/acylcarnitine transporter), member 20/29
MDSFASGCVSGFSQILIGHPLDTYKTWLQNGSQIPRLKFSTLYRGIRYPLLSNCVLNGILFGTNSILTNKVSNQWISGGITGIATTFICTPMELYKIRRQCQVANTTNIFHGFTPTLAREILSCSIYFGTYHYLYHTNDFSSFWAGGIAGVACWGLVHPIDTVKTKIQSGYSTDIRSALKSGGLWTGVGFSCTRAFLVNSIGFWVFQNTLEYLK